MRRPLWRHSFATGALALASAVSAAPELPVPPRSAAYDPASVFAPFPLDPAPTRVRTADGRPGPDYWQNQADYEIHARLDPVAKSISGTVEIRYTNNSPSALDVLWLLLEQNRYRPNSRGNLSSGGALRGSTDGMILESVSVEIQGRTVEAVPLVTDTRAQLRLPQPLAPKGVATLRIRYHYTIPGDAFGGRTGWLPAKDGRPIFSIAQWFPRMAVYDDLRGWDPLPYLAQEFYLDYGNFDYTITAPADMIVAGSGALVNPEEVLSPAEQERLSRARASDATIMIRTPEESETPTGTAERASLRNWHFRMSHTRDVAFAASAAFAWDAARIRLPGGGASLAMSFYPSESEGAERWGRSTEYLKDAVERFSSRWYPYPWPAAINIAGAAAGMEYPGIVFDGIDDAGKTLFWITAHEIGHSWFPMIVGFDERRNAWMDEGFNTFIDTFESNDFANGAFGPKRDPEFAPGGGNPVDEILPVLADREAAPILSRADTVSEKYRHPVTYFKSALGLLLLRNEILGPDRFDPAFRRFISNWAYKHPTPADFFRAMESDAGEDLSWWWRGWYENNWQLDLAVTAIKPYPASGTQRGTLVTVECRDRLVMPVTLRVKFADGSSRDIRLPAETWVRQAAVDVPVEGAARVVGAELYPDHRLPDRDRSNNLFKTALQ